MPDVDECPAWSEAKYEYAKATGNGAYCGRTIDATYRFRPDDDGTGAGNPPCLSPSEVETGIRVAQTQISHLACGNPSSGVAVTQRYPDTALSDSTTLYDEDGRVLAASQADSVPSSEFEYGTDGVAKGRITEALVLPAAEAPVTPEGEQPVTGTVSTTPRQTTWSYGNDGFVSAVTLPDGTTRTWSRDAVGRVLQTLLTAGGDSYGGAGFQYDLAGQLLALNVPDEVGGTNGPTYGYSYDVNGRVASETLPSGAGLAQWNTELSYDHDDMVTSVVLPGGLTITVEHATSGLIEGMEMPLQATGSTSTLELQIGYENIPQTTTALRANQVSRVVDSQIDAVHSVDFEGPFPIRERLSGGELPWIGQASIEYAWHASQELRSFEVAGPAGEAWHSSLVREDKLGRIDQVVLAVDGEELPVAVTRDAATGLVTRQIVGDPYDNAPDVETLYWYGEFGELAAVETRRSDNPSSPLYREQYSRDALGRITERDITALAGGPTVTCAMDYSYAQQRLKSEVPSSASGCGTYTVGLLYDGRGNVLKHTAATPSATTLSITGADYDAQDRVVSYGASPASEPCNGGAVPVTYDRAGRVHKQGATTYTYDLLGNLLKVETLDAADLCASVTVTYDVDPQNRRVGRSVDGVFDAGWLYIGGPLFRNGQRGVIAELDSAGKVVKSFTYGVSGHSPSAMMYRDPATGSVRRFAFVQEQGPATPNGLALAAIGRKRSIVRVVAGR